MIAGKFFAIERERERKRERVRERERVTERVVAFKIQIFIIYLKKSKNKNPVISFP